MARVEWLPSSEERRTRQAAWRRATAGVLAALAVLALPPRAAAEGPSEAGAKPATEQDAPSTAAQPSASSAASLEERLNQPVSANFQDVDFTSAVDFLAEHAAVTIVLSDKAKAQSQPVTVHLVEMPLRRALAYLLEGQGLLFRYEGDTIWVSTRDDMEAEPLETRVFLLSRGPGLAAAFEPLSDVRQSVALQAKNVKEMTTIRELLLEVIPAVRESRILLDERTGALIVAHVPYYLQQVEGLLEQLDVAPLQVAIEARFVQVTLKDTKEWSLDSQLTGNASLTKGPGRDGSTEGPELQLSSDGTTLKRGTKIGFSDFANQTAGHGLNLTLQGILTGTQYAAVLHALMEQKKTKTLSAPRVTTLNNRTATIKIVTEFVYATRYQPTVERKDLNSDGDFTDVVSGVRETRFINAPQDFVTKDLGILLHVTPSVGQDARTITLALKPEVSEKTADDTFTGSVTLPRFSARNLETSVVIEDGETVMLGGLMKDTTSRTVTKLPLLGSLPVLGVLFRKENDSVERSNLLIFVTANIVSPAGARLARQDPSP